MRVRLDRLVLLVVSRDSYSTSLFGGYFHVNLGQTYPHLINTGVKLNEPRLYQNTNSTEPASHYHCVH